MKKWLLTLTLLLAVSLALPVFAEADRFAFDKSVTTLFAGETLQTVLQRAGKAAEGDVTYKSSAEHIGTVDENGLVTGVGKGRVLITATCKNGKRTFTASISLVVNVKAESVSLKTDNLSMPDPADPLLTGLIPEDNTLPVVIMSVGTTYTLSGDVQPTNAQDRTVIYTASDEEVLSIKNRTAKPLKTGVCTLTLTSKQNPEVTQAYCVLCVQPIRTLKLSASAKTLYVGDAAFLFAEITPEDASFPAVSWESLNEKILTVDAAGTVTAVAKGSATVRATALDGSGRTATISLTVKQQPESITLGDTEMSVPMGSTKSLKYNIAPKNVDERAVTWHSSDETVAKISSSGRVTPVSVGQCIITCRSAAFPSVSASCTVTVIQPVTKVAFLTRNPTVNVGETVSLLWETAPANATNPAVTFSSSNTKIATVDEYGVVTGVKRGTATITAAATDGSGRKGTVKVNVLQPVYGVHMYSDLITVGVDETVTARAVLEPENASNTRMTWVSADTTIATVSGKNTKPSVTGQRWGETTITGTTEDGGYTATATVKVGNYDRALIITDLYLQDNQIKIGVINESNMTVTRFTFDIEVYDLYGQPLPCTTSGSHTFSGSYAHTLYEGDATRHGKFYFNRFVQPSTEIGMVVMTITGYATDTGYARTIKPGKQTAVEYMNPNYVGELPAYDNIVQER